MLECWVPKPIGWIKNWINHEKHPSWIVWNWSRNFKDAINPAKTTTATEWEPPNENSHVRFFIKFKNVCAVFITVKMIFGQKFSKWEFSLGVRAANSQSHLDRPQNTVPPMLLLSIISFNVLLTFDPSCNDTVDPPRWSSSCPIKCGCEEEHRWTPNRLQQEESLLENVSCEFSPVCHIFANNQHAKLHSVAERDPP